MDIRRIDLETSFDITAIPAISHGLLAADCLTHINSLIGGAACWRHHAPKRWHSGAVAPESIGHQLRRLYRAHFLTVRAQHNSQNGASLAGCGAGQIEARSTDKAGLHAIGTIKATEQNVVIGLWLLAVARINGLSSEIMRILREFAAQLHAKHGKVVRCRIIVRIMQTVWIGKMRTTHADALCFRIHALHKSRFRTANSFRDRNGHVIGRFHQHDLERSIERHHRAGTITHLARWLFRGVDRHAHRRFQRQLPCFNRAEGDISRHHLGQRSRIPALERILRGVDLATCNIHRNRWICQSRR